MDGLAEMGSDGMGWEFQEDKPELGGLVKWGGSTVEATCSRETFLSSIERRARPIKCVPIANVIVRTVPLASGERTSSCAISTSRRGSGPGTSGPGSGPWASAWCCRETFPPDGSSLLRTRAEPSISLKPVFDEA